MLGVLVLELEVNASISLMGINGMDNEKISCRRCRFRCRCQSV